MTPIEIVLAIVLAGVVVEAYLHRTQIAAALTTLKADSEQDLATVKADFQVAVNKLEGKASAPAPAAQSVTVHPITVTTGAPAAAVQPTTTAPATAPTVNGVAVPPDTDYATFGALVVATQAVKASLATPGIDFTQQTAAWWASLGRFMREEYLAQATGAVLAHFQTLVGPPLETISVMDQTAANAAVNAVTNKP